MKFTCAHGTDRKAAIDIVDSFLAELTAKVPDEIKVRNLTKRWAGSNMHFGFQLKKGFLISLNVSGQVQVTEKDATFHLNLPALALSAMPEHEISSMIKEKFAAAAVIA